MKVDVRQGRLDKALSILRKKCADDLFELRDREAYQKPSDRRRAALKKAKIREKRRKGAD